MAKAVTAVCPRCSENLKVDPLGAEWPHHLMTTTSGVTWVCAESGQPMPHVTGETLKTKGTPSILIKDEVIEEKLRVASPSQGKAGGWLFEAVAIRLVNDAVHLHFPALDGLAAHFERPEDGGASGPGVVKVRLGESLLAPRLRIEVEFPHMPSFSSPEEADAWLERMAE